MRSFFKQCACPLTSSFVLVVVAEFSNLFTLVMSVGAWAENEDRSHAQTRISLYYVDKLRPKKFESSAFSQTFLISGFLNDFLEVFYIDFDERG